MPLHLTVDVLTQLDDSASYDLVAVGATSSESGIVALATHGTPFAGVVIPEVIDATFAERHRFEAKPGQSLVLSQAPGSPTVLLVGMGPSSADVEERWRQAAATVVRAAKGSRALLVVPAAPADTEAAAVGALLASYRYDVRSTEEPEGLNHLDLLVRDPDDLTGARSGDALVVGRAVASAVSTARDFVNRFPSELTPTRLAEDAAAALSVAPGVSVEIWDEERIDAERLGGLLGVARGSEQPPRLVKAVYTPPGGEPSSHVVLVGKGITFDSGGLSLKTAGGMTTMKTDMTGAAVVLSAMTALAALGVTAKVTAIAPMSENMPSGSAMKPGDVLTSRSGTTIEVLNTDAEGRLILADGLTLAVEEDPDMIIDVATLTGAAIAALGTGVGALLTNDDDAADALIEAAKGAGEKLWRLPLVEEYESHIKSDLADIKNVGTAGEAGTISAGLFLQRFVGDKTWVHLDIAGPARSDKDAGYVSKGGTAFGLLTILAYLRSLG